QVRHALEQNLNVLKQRLMRIRKLDELVRLLEARLQVIRNSLGLVQDEVYTFTDVAGLSGLVGHLLTHLRVSEQFRTPYDDPVRAREASPTAHEGVLSDESGIGGTDHLLGGGDASAELELPEEETRRQRQPERAQRTK